MNCMTAPKPKRHWSRFSLRTLLVFLLVLSLPLGWFALKLHKARRQREAVGAIVEMGGFVYYDYQLEKGSMLPDPAAEPGSPAWLRRLLGDDFFCHAESVCCGTDRVLYADASYDVEPDFESLVVQLQRLPHLEHLRVHGEWMTADGPEHLATLANLQSLRLSDTQITDDGLRHLAKLNRLKTLQIWEAEITDKGLEHLGGMTELEHLDLYCSRVSDNGLVHLKGLTQLKALSVDGSHITDVGLVCLKDMANLRSLSLSDTEITDIGLQHLRDVSSLEYLWVENTHVTAEGVKKLQQVLPKCRIFRLPHHP
jgi:hypothetical protein